MSKQFSLDAYRRAVADYDATWRVTDETLYRLCRQHPGHVEAVYAKLWIIGRTYATGIERKIATKQTQGSSLSQLAAHLLRHSAEADDLVAMLNAVAEPLQPDAVQTILHVHGRFTELVKRMTRRNQSPRSFVSKYLHFHCPAVPIYDSIVAGVLPKFVRWHSDLMLCRREPWHDATYCWYLMRFWNLYDNVRKSGVNGDLRVKHLDHFLLADA
jgi:hypothetical protein